MSNIKELFKQINIELTDTQISQFETYTNLLISYNEKVNLTAITDPEEINLKHYLDSCLPVLTNCFQDGLKVVDVGCGAGFPSVPLKIVNPNLDFTLIDSLNKRIHFLNNLIKELKLPNIKTIHSRAEDAGQDKALREQFDICVARAVAPLNILLEYCTPFVKKGGYFIALKGKEAENEIQTSKNAIQLLGISIENTLELTLPHTDHIRKIVVFKKIANTNKAYPRKAGKPSKNPL